jgi:hypothetical protein
MESQSMKGDIRPIDWGQNPLNTSQKKYYQKNNRMHTKLGYINK